MPQNENRTLVFDEFVIDLDAAVVSRGDAATHVEPQVFDLIAYLAENCLRLVSYDEIVEQVWQGRAVSDAAIATRINGARRALGDDGSTQRIIKTIRGRGLRFELRPIERSSPTRDDEAQASHEDARPVTDASAWAERGPSIAVLPFDNMSDDPSQEYLGDGIAEDIITGLSRVRQFFVIARNSTFTYKGKAADVRQVGIELGVTYLLEGSVRKYAEKVRVTAQLVDADTGHHIWADRFDGELVDIFDLQDRVTSSVIGAIQPSIRSAESARARRKRPDSIVAYDLYMQALPHVSALGREDNRRALELLERAMNLEAGFVSALSMAAWCHAQRCVYNWTDDWEMESRRAVLLAREAVGHAGDDSFALAMLGAAHTLVREFDTGRRLLEHAVEVNPNCSWSWNRLGWLNGYCDKPKESVDCFDRAIRLSPLDRMNFNCHVGIGSAYFMEKNYSEAVDWMEKAIAANPGARWIFRQLVPAYVFAGRDLDAARSLPLLLEEYPGLTCETVRHAMLYSEVVMDQICSGLEQAGLPVN